MHGEKERVCLFGLLKMFEGQLLFVLTSFSIILVEQSLCQTAAFDFLVSRHILLLMVCMSFLAFTAYTRADVKTC